MNQRPKLAFVLPWYGQEIPGGAEAEAHRTIKHLAAAGYTVEVFTTCIKDFFADWHKNHHRPGSRTENGILVHRYPVGPRNKAKFDLLNQKIIGRIPLTPQETADFADNFINAPDLLAAIYKNRNNYLFFFIPYLFPTTYYGLPLVPQNSVLIPCLHNEGYAFTPLMRRTMPLAGAMVYHTESERRLAQSIYDLPDTQIQTVLGEGVDAFEPGDGQAFKQKFGIDGPYILYAGRKSHEKNVWQLMTYWNEYILNGGRYDRLKLIFIGPGSVEIPPLMKDNTLDLGYVSALDKRNAFAGASVFVQPSLNESFSLVLMDAWQAGKPVLVNGFSDVLVEHVQRAQGGLYYGSHEEFVAMVDWLLDHVEEAAQMGQNGRKYVQDNYMWEQIIPKYEALIAQMAERMGAMA